MPRPPKYTPAKLEKGIEKYFRHARLSGDDITIEDLCQSLGIIRKTLWNYEQDETYLHIIKMAKERIYAHWVRMLCDKERPMAGVIFYLKNHAGMTDKQVVEQTGNTSVVQLYIPDNNRQN